MACQPSRGAGTPHGRAPSPAGFDPGARDACSRQRGAATRCTRAARVRGPAAVRGGRRSSLFERYAFQGECDGRIHNYPLLEPLVRLQGNHTVTIANLHDTSVVLRLWELLVEKPSAQ